jgi:hypothetical protein
MPYKSEEKNRIWHREHMRMKRLILKGFSKQMLHTNSGVVTPSTLTIVRPQLDADGNVIYVE